MFQSFKARTRPEDGPPRVAALRAEMVRAGVDAFLVPRADRFQGEYVAPRDERLAWLTGFTGSAGFAVVLAESAAIFVDGRYRVQVRAQSDMDTFTPVDWPETKLETWLADMLPGGGVVAYDPWLHTAAEIERLNGALGRRQIALRPEANLVDRIWTDRPGPPEAPARSWPEAYAGLSAEAKLAAVAGDLADAGEDAALVTQPDSICWLLNLRGGDVGHTPLLHAMGLVHRSGRLDLFVAPSKLAGIGLPEGVTAHPEEDLAARLAAATGLVRVDRNSAPQAAVDALSKGTAEVVAGSDPCLLRKARKHPAEIAATTEAHLRDGAAFARFLRWFDETAPGGGLTEIDVVRALEGFRAETGALKDISFDTIAGAGPHGAIVHYRVTEGTNAPVVPGQLFLIDSGAQYEDGTTDITRTLPVGDVGEEERTAFTQVLRGMIAIHRARFPKGVAGAHLDALARAPLWAAGRDFDHGTGHGVGVYLGVHEGPQRLSRVSTVPLEPGMVLSNEPGYYREGAFGIRIENLVVVTEAPPLPGGDAARRMLAFETLTWAPIDRRLIRAGLLCAEERAWLDAYHAGVAERIAPRLDAATAAWLREATRPLGGD
ncbi:aminopeptidase P family protein [Roseibacterium sp. SDUM158017]|uniref:aminopeptidase P family protein n=1 Tax=Roseicyclus salinarum TaxID=3036773 RepID=UPI0024158376|nr:aminopeptidase P family protein [Roseibacterium sp. SDUM158017]MDG4647673.1 aminopeptidase P family protein [Roseibacterium sp. SDUM158017]